jgi:hypothetical protein
LDNKSVGPLAVGLIIFLKRRNEAYRWYVVALDGLCCKYQVFNFGISPAGQEDGERILKTEE